MRTMILNLKEKKKNERKVKLINYVRNGNAIRLINLIN